MERNLIRNTIILGLVAIPIIDILLYFFVPGWDAGSLPDTRVIKEYSCFGTLLVLGCTALYQGRIKRIDNIWIYLLVAYLFFHIFRAPVIPMFMQLYFKYRIGGFWMWKPMMYAFIAFMGFLGIASAQFKSHDTIHKCIRAIGCIVSVYAVLQLFGLDQLYISNVANPYQIYTPSSNIGATFGHPTLMSSFLVLCFPFAFCNKKYFQSALIIIAILISQSSVAIGSLVVVLCIIGLRVKKIRWYLVGCLISAAIMVGIFHNHKMVIDFGTTNGRIACWTQIIKDVRSPVFKEKPGKAAIFGRGIGSYQYLFTTEHKSPFDKAHNEYLEVLYNCGIVGLFLMAMALLKILSQMWKGGGPYLYAFIGICLCAGGTFVWQLVAHIYYTIVILGLFYQGVKNE